MGSALNQIAYGEVMKAAVRDYCKVRAPSACNASGAAAGTLQFGSNNSQSQRTPAAKAIRAALVDASNYVSCVLAPRGGCQEAYRAQDQQRRERTQGVLRLE